MKKTKLTTSPAEAARFIIEGGTAAFPTETVYGLGANVFDESAVAKIFEAKRRPADNPLIAHISTIDQIRELTTEVTESAEKLIGQFFPGPLTLVLKKSERVPAIATAGLDSIGIRMPRNGLANEFITACRTPLAAPSANLSGRPSPTTWQAVYEDLNDRIDCILQGEPTEIGLESTVVDCRTSVPLVLRLGAVSLEDIRSVVFEAVLADPRDEARVRSPGSKHKHYSPKADVDLVDWIIFDSPHEHAAYIGMDRGVETHYLGMSRICSSIEDYAHSVFEFFRECDRAGIRLIYCQEVAEEGIGAALMDRIRRAAEE